MYLPLRQYRIIVRDGKYSLACARPVWQTMGMSKELSAPQVKALRVIAMLHLPKPPAAPRESWINKGTFRCLLAFGMVERVPNSGLDRSSIRALANGVSPLVKPTAAGWQWLKDNGHVE